MPETQNKTNQADHSVENENKTREALFLAVEGNVLLKILVILLQSELQVPEEIKRNMHAVVDRVATIVSKSSFELSEINDLYGRAEEKLYPAVFNSIVSGEADKFCVLDHWRGTMPPKEAYFIHLL